MLLLLLSSRLVRAVSLGVVVWGVVLAWSSGASATTLYYDAVIADNPVSYWRLNDGAPGAIVNDSDTARSYDASGSLSFGYSADLNTPEFTVEAWAKIESFCACSGGYRTILDSRGGGTHFSGYQLGIPSGSDEALLGFQVGDSTTWRALHSDFINVGEWYHLAGTFDGTTQEFFVNGQLVGSQSTSYTQNLGASFGIGTGYPLSGGLVDEVAYYNYALGADRVENHYLTGIGVIPEPTTALLLTLGLAGLGVRRRH